VSRRSNPLRYAESTIDDYLTQAELGRIVLAAAFILSVSLGCIPFLIGMWDRVSIKGISLPNVACGSGQVYVTGPAGKIPAEGAAR
jgi:hypothetical protein